MKYHTRWLPMLALVCAVCYLFQGSPRAAEPAKEQRPTSRDPKAVAAEIDQVLSKRLASEKVPASPVADDAEFLRRACLDLTGRIPTAAEARTFLDSKDSGKRAKLIDALLASSRYGEHLASLWTSLVTAAGDPDARPDTKAFTGWLAKEFNGGRGWDRIVHEMLTAQGTPAANAATIYTQTASRQPGFLASSATQLFLGMRIQCAECHNHPFNDFKQTDYWGMAAFFGRINGAGAKNAKGGGEIAETAVPKGNAKKKGDATVASGSTITIPATGGNKGAGKVVPAQFFKGEKPDLPAEGAIRPHLAGWITSPKNPFFARAAVNRVWGLLFGRGFVNPIDDFENGVPPSHPELLDALAREFVASGHDVKHLIRCLCNTQAYQRTSRALPGNKDDEALFSRMTVKVMTPEVMYDSLCSAMGLSALPGGLASQPRYGDGKGKNAKGKATAKPDPRVEFVKFFSTREDPAENTEFTNGIPQALGLLNNAQFNRVTPTVEKLAKANLPPEQAIEELFLATLSRRPTADELKLMLGYLTKSKDVAQGYADVLWILFNASEFVLNH